MYSVNNAIILAAGLSSRFAPLSYEMPKSLVKVKGEVLIERQIKQLKEAGISDIIIVVGYKKEKFYYLEKKYGIKIIVNDEYLSRNNNSSIYAARKYLKNTYICCADNYFVSNPFEKVVDFAYYATVFADGKTDEWCLSIDENDVITDVQIGGHHQWYMLGHVFWTEEFSKRFIQILEKEYDNEETKDKLWEQIYVEHIDELPLKVKKYPNNFIYEFDSLDDLRKFDMRYITRSHSKILKEISNILNCEEKDIENCIPYKRENITIGFSFVSKNKKYLYMYEKKKLKQLEEKENER